MKTAIIVSIKDIAGMNIKSTLIKSFGLKETSRRFEEDNVYELNNIKLYTITKDTVNANNLDKEIDADFFIFATRHSAKAGVKTLSVHTPGNWDSAELGGLDKKLCLSPAERIKQAYLLLKRLNNLEGFEVTLEATHHGPYLKKPCLFIEIGSTKTEWQNKKAAQLISKAIIELINKPKEDFITVIGIGGTHYATNFNKILSRTELSIGHICPKYMLEVLTKHMIRQAIEKSTEKVQYVLVDWKGLGKEKQRITKMLDYLGLHYKRIKDFLK